MHPPNRKIFTNTWADAHSSLWTEKLAEFCGVDRVKALEIGSMEGRSASWFLDNVLTGRDSTLTCVDLWRNKVTENLFNLNTAEYGRRLVKIKSSSLGFMCRRIGEGRRAIYDFIYIDGDHSGVSCLQDAVLAWHLVKSRGLLIFDDCGTRYTQKNSHRQIVPRVSVDAFLRTRNNFETLHDANQIIVRKL